MSDNNDEDIRTADAIRSLMVITDSWKNDKELFLDEMTGQLDALCNDLEKTSDFQEFSRITNLTGQERLN